MAEELGWTECKGRPSDPLTKFKRWEKLAKKENSATIAEIKENEEDKRT